MYVRCGRAPPIPVVALRSGSVGKFNRCLACRFSLFGGPRGPSRSCPTLGPAPELDVRGPNSDFGLTEGGKKMTLPRERRGRRGQCYSPPPWDDELPLLKTKPRSAPTIRKRSPARATRSRPHASRPEALAVFATACRSWPPSISARRRARVIHALRGAQALSARVPIIFLSARDSDFDIVWPAPGPTITPPRTSLPHLMGGWRCSGASKRWPKRDPGGGPSSQARRTASRRNAPRRRMARPERGTDADRI